MIKKIIRFFSVRKKIFIWFRGYAYRIRRNQLLKVLLAIFIVAFVAAAAVTFLERDPNSQFTNITHGLWWALVTMTTVGYGDMVPSTPLGRVLASIIMLTGVVLISTFTAAVSTMVITKRLKEGRGLSEIKVKDHITILGWNPFGEDIIRDLLDKAIHENRTIVLINKMNPDHAEEIIYKFKNLQIKFVHGDFTDETVLTRANINEAYAAIILPDESDSDKPKSDETTILACLTVKSIEPKVKVITHILEASNESHLRRANADKIVVSNQFSGFLLANHVVAPGIPETIDVLLDSRKGMRLSRCKLPRNLIGKRFSEISTYFKQGNDSILLGFIKEEPGFKLDNVLTDDYSSIDEFIRNKLESAGKGLAKKSTIDILLNPPHDYLATERDIAVVIEKMSS